jgi:hypothetical protein
LLFIDHYACVEYLTKYAANGEPRSPILKQAFISIVQNVDSNTDPRRVIKKVVMKCLGERDYAAQETMHHLLSLKLHSSSFKVMPVSLNGSRRVRDTASIDEGEPCTDYSFLDVYGNRAQYDSSQNIINMNFVEFATTYSTKLLTMNCQNCQRMLYHEYFQHILLILKVQILAYIVNINF